MIFHSLIPVELVANRKAEVCELAKKKISKLKLKRREYRVWRKAADGRRSPRRWGRIPATPDYAKRLGVRQSSGAFERGGKRVGVGNDFERMAR
jgi:hypothetical protein